MIKHIIHDKFWLVVLTISTLVGGASLVVNTYKTIGGACENKTAFFGILLGAFLVIIPWLVAYITYRNLES